LGFLLIGNAVSIESVEQAGAWAEENGGEEGLRIAIADGRFGSDKRKIAFAEEWLRQKHETREKESIQEERLLRAREVIAAEASATAAKESAVSARDSADAASKSAKWAFWMTIIALLAVIVALFK
jgi:hypothetical protein